MDVTPSPACIQTLTILASECTGSPDGEMDPLLLMGGPGIPGMFGTMDIGRASYQGGSNAWVMEAEVLSQVCSVKRLCNNSPTKHIYKS